MDPIEFLKEEMEYQKLQVADFIEASFEDGFFEPTEFLQQCLIRDDLELDKFL